MPGKKSNIIRVIIPLFWNQILQTKNKTMKTENIGIVEATDQNLSALKSTASTLLVTFGASWCHSCKMMEPVLAELTADFAGHATVAKVDVENNQAIIAQYGIRNIPALLLFKDGQLVQRYTGTTPKKILSAQLAHLVHAKAA